MDANEICERIQRRGGGRVAVALFEDQPWKLRHQALGSVGLCTSPAAKWFEVSREDAQGLVIAALSRDLCYGARVMAQDDARRLIEPFFEMMHFQTRYFTNSSVPYHRRDPSAWAYNSVGPGTLSMGVAFELAKSLTAVFWISDWD